MSVDILLDLQQETRRLFIAGSGLAAGDLRLKKLLPQLQTLGESAPVFKRVAAAVQQTIEPLTEDAAAPLLELATLLQSILYTQGKTDIAEPAEEFVVAWIAEANQIPYRKLKPLLDALTQKGPGRLEIITQAYNERLFTDYRTMIPAIEALDETYTDISEFMFKTVLAEYGLPSLAALQQKFKLQGGKGDARKLHLIHLLLGISGKESYMQTLEEGSLDVQIAAIEILANYPEFETILLEQSKEKRKEIRRVALVALAKLQTAAALDRLYQALTSKDQEIAVEAIQQCRVDSLTEQILAYAEQQFVNLDNTDSKNDPPAQLLAALRCFEREPEPKIFGFLSKLTSNDNFMLSKHSLIKDCAVELLLDLNSAAANELVMSFHHKWKGLYLTQSFKASIRMLSPKELYNEYSGDLKNKQKTGVKELLRLISHSTRRFINYEMESRDVTLAQKWDPRWIGLFMEINEVELVCYLVLTPDKKVISYLLKQLENEPNVNHRRSMYILDALYKLEHRNTPMLLFDILEKSSPRQIYQLSNSEMNLLLNLPSSYSERLKQLSEALTYESVKKQILEVVEALEARAAEKQPDEKGEGLFKWIKNKMF